MTLHARGRLLWLACSYTANCPSTPESYLLAYWPQADPLAGIVGAVDILGRTASPSAQCQTILTQTWSVAFLPPLSQVLIKTVV